MNAPSTATIDNSNKYGFGRFPHGLCQDPGCERAACHDYQGTKVCRDHLPKEVIFCPFLGQQTKLFAATERYVLGGGGAGGSKTFCGSRLYMKQWVVAQDHWKKTGDRTRGWSLFLRRTIPELLQVISDFLGYYQKVDAGARWVAMDKMAVFPNGYTVQFGGMEHEQDIDKYWGNAYSLVVADEATQFYITQLERIDQRIRLEDRDPLAKMLQFYYLTNPLGGLTKQWLKRRFVKPAPPETSFVTEVKLEDGRVKKARSIYIPSNLFDNPALVDGGDYEATLRRHSQATIRALLYNDWDVDEGTWIGEDWQPQFHICEPFVIPNGWFKFKMADYGFRARSSILWIAVDPDDNWICYRSWSQAGLTVGQVAARVREIEAQPLVIKMGSRRITVTGPEWDEINECSTVYGPMDNELWSGKTETGESRGEILQTAGTGFSRSNKDPDGAAEHIRSRLRRRTRTGKGDEVVAGLRFFSTCKTRIHKPDGTWDETGPVITIPTIPFDTNNPDRWDTTADDHDLDALGYGALSRPMTGSADEPLPPGQGVVYDILKLRQSQKQQNTLPEWYRHHG
jgi:hypothetical protein